MTHFAGGFTLFIGKDLTILGGRPIRGESLPLNTRQRTQGENPLVYTWQEGLRLVIASQDRCFAVMLDRPLNMSCLCSVTRKKETKQWEIGRKGKRESLYICVYI